MDTKALTATRDVHDSHGRGSRWSMPALHRVLRHAIPDELLRGTVLSGPLSVLKLLLTGWRHHCTGRNWRRIDEWFLGHDSALRLYWANKINFIMNHAPGAGSNPRPVDQQSSALPIRTHPNWKRNRTKWNEFWFRPWICTVREYWSGDYLGWWNEF